MSLPELVKKQLTYFGTLDRNIHIAGEDIQLRPQAVQGLGMAIHELATNASKYGALSVPGGQINIIWEIIGDGDNAQLKLIWRECGGPIAVEPLKKGFGSQILEKHTASALRGQNTLDYDAEGLVWTLTAPMSAVAVKD